MGCSDYAKTTKLTKEEIERISPQELAELLGRGRISVQDIARAIGSDSAKFNVTIAIAREMGVDVDSPDHVFMNYMGKRKPKKIGVKEQEFLQLPAAKKNPQRKLYWENNQN
jgi:hypothetical protein